MLLTNEEQKRLNEMFRQLWILCDRKSQIKGCWGTSAYRDHRIYLRRGALLMKGSDRFDCLFVLVPADCKVTPVYGDSRASMDISPKIENGEAIRINYNDDGPWWDALRQLIPQIEAEIAQVNEVQRLKQEEETAIKLAAYQAKMDAAKQSVLQSLGK